MCGIAGMMKRNAPAFVDELSPMLEALYHRGPDGRGSCAEGSIAIGMTRLAIIDVAGGQQPIYNENRTIALVCNGEIYNHRELRSSLEQRGHRFATHSDVEVVLHLYEEKGDACFGELNGMFGAAIADFRRGAIVLGRDPFGQKSLYLRQTPQGWMFASELKALVAAPGFRKVPSMEALAAFLQFRYVPAPLTIFEGVSKLPPGSTCTLNGKGDLTTRRYFQVAFPSADSEAMTDPDGRVTRDQFHAAVDRHLMSERPLGVFLSGGLDSSAIVASMHANGHSDIRTFTVGFRDFWDNELDTGEAVARHFGTHHTQVIVEPDQFWSCLEPVVWSADEPLADLTTVPLYLLAEAASKELVVVLSGEGSDELLAGYAGMEELRTMGEQPWRINRSTFARDSIKHLPFGNLFAQRMLNLIESPANYLARVQGNMTNVFSERLRHEWCDDLLQGYRPGAVLSDYYAERQSWNPVNLYLGGLIEWWLPDDLLHKADRMTMAHSLELRCPFLDSTFARHCLSLRLDDKVQSRLSPMNRKAALKKAFKDVLPQGFAARPKKGFSIPVYEWLSTVYRERMEHELARESALGTSLLKKSALRRLSASAAEGDQASQRQAWSLLVLNRWGDVWL